jgi:putative ABC transport system permease protein
MIRIALKSATAHKVRLMLTALAIVLGVAFVSGTYVFTDTIQARFDTLFHDVYSGSTPRSGLRPRTSARRPRVSRRPPRER